MLQLKKEKKVLHAACKTQHRQINKQILKKKKKTCLPTICFAVSVVLTVISLTISKDRDLLMHWRAICISFSSLNTLCLLKDVTLADLSSEPGIWRLLPAPALGMYSLPSISTVGALFRRQPWESAVVLRPSGKCPWANPVKAAT